jgi:hypothetical protein
VPVAPAVRLLFAAGPKPWSPTAALFGRDVFTEFQDANSDDRQAMLLRVRRIAVDGRTAVIATVTRHEAAKNRSDKPDASHITSTGPMVV